MPDPLALLTTYYLIKLDANTVQFAASLDDAQDGIFIVLTTAGSGNAVATIHITTASAGDMDWFKSNSPEGPWVLIHNEDLSSSVVNFMISQPNVSYRYFKFVKTMPTGEVDVKAYVLVLGDAE